MRTNYAGCKVCRTQNIRKQMYNRTRISPFGSTVRINSTCTENSYPRGSKCTQSLIIKHRANYAYLALLFSFLPGANSTSHEQSRVFVGNAPQASQYLVQPRRRSIFLARKEFGRVIFYKICTPERAITSWHEMRVTFRRDYSNRSTLISPMPIGVYTET